MAQGIVGRHLQERHLHMTISNGLRKVGAVGIGAVLAGSLVVPSVSAHTETYASTVTIRQDGEVFKGAVQNARPRCQHGRQVTVFKARKNRPNKVIGSDRTNRHGNWYVPTDPRPDRGRYFARAAGRADGRYGHNHRCAADRSVIISPNS